MNGIQITGTVHAARPAVNPINGAAVLAPICARLARSVRVFLGATDRPITCKRCIAKLAKAATK